MVGPGQEEGNVVFVKVGCPYRPSPPYAMSGTGIAYAHTHSLCFIRLPYAMSGTDIAYAAARREEWGGMRIRLKRQLRRWVCPNQSDKACSWYSLLRAVVFFGVDFAEHRGRVCVSSEAVRVCRIVCVCVYGSYSVGGGCAQHSNLVGVGVHMAGTEPGVGVHMAGTESGVGVREADSEVHTGVRVALGGRGASALHGRGCE
eukprot:2494876-Rhodomonas_salina.2